MVVDRMKRWRGSETIRGEDVRKLLEQVGDTLPGERRAEKICPEDWNRYRSQLEHPLEVTRTKT